MFLVFILIITLLVSYLIRQMLKPSNYPPGSSTTGGPSNSSDLCFIYKTSIDDGDLVLMKESGIPALQGPFWYPFVGNIPELKKLSKSLGAQYRAMGFLSEKYKTNLLGLKLGSEYVVVVFTYPLIRQVLTSEVFEGRPDNFFFRLRCLGKRSGITGTDGEVWNTQRNFVNRHLRNLGFGKNPMEELVRDEVSEMLQILKTDGCDISINKFLAPGVLNVLWALVTGARIPRENSQLKELLDLFNMRSKAFDMTGGTLSQYPWLRYVAPEWSGYNLIQKVNAAMKDLFVKTIRKHQQSWEEGKNDDLIYRYISEMNMNNKITQDFTEEQLITVCLDLFIGGAQTTSGTLDFAFLIMIIHPEIQRKVHDQIDKHLGKCVIEYSDRHKVPYIEAVLLEIIRFRHVVPITGPRRALKDTVLGGYAIPKDTTVLISTHSVHNSPEYWKNPELFMPERFLSEEGLLETNENLIPFGLGRRRCIGEVLAKTCIFVFFTEILRKYTISLAAGSEPLTGKCLAGITLSPEHYKAKFTERL